MSLQLLSIKCNCLRVRWGLNPSRFPLSDSVYPPQSSTEVCSRERGGWMSSSSPVTKGQSQSLSWSSRGVHRSVRGQLGVCAPRHGRAFRARHVCAVLNPHPVPGSRSCTWNGILRPLVLLLHLWLRVHKQRTFDGAHEGSWGGHHQHHPEQGAAAEERRSPGSRLRLPTFFKYASVAFALPTSFSMTLYLKMMCFQGV